LIVNRVFAAAKKDDSACSVRPTEERVVLAQHFDEWVEDVLSRSAEKIRVRVQRFVRLPIQARRMPHELFAAGARFDRWDRRSLRWWKTACVRTSIPRAWRADSVTVCGCDRTCCTGANALRF
jgi:hypothetical protein